MKKFADMNEQGGLWVMTDLFVAFLNDLVVIWGSGEQAAKRRENRYCVRMPLSAIDLAGQHNP